MAKSESGVNLQIADLERWWRSRPVIQDAFSPDFVRGAVLHLMCGGNYRDITERCVRERLNICHSWLLSVAHQARAKFGATWAKTLLKNLLNSSDKHQVMKDLQFWLVGLMKKTAENLELKPTEPKEFLEFLDAMFAACQNVAANARWPSGNVTIGLVNEKTRQTELLGLDESLWLLQIVGASTLTLRGSNKAIFGKRFERAFLRASLELLGLKLDQSFWLNIERDAEVGREADAEVETKRGRIRIDMGLIGVGNQEVSEDKLNRVGRNGVVLVDRLGRKSSVMETAERLGVKLIQIRHQFPLTEIYHHLKRIVRVELKEPPKTKEGLRREIAALPSEAFKCME
jgi:hypothetical protein